MTYIHGTRIAAAVLGVSALVALGACVPETGVDPTTTTTTTGVTTTTIDQTGPDCSPFKPFSGANFGIGCSLAGMSFDGIDISKSYGPEMNLTKTSFTNSTLDGANLKYSNAPGLVVTKSSAVGFALHGSDSKNLVNATNSTWEDVDLTDAGFFYTDFSKSTFTNVNLSGANLNGSVWTDASLTKIQVSDSTICPDGELHNAKDLCRGSLPGF